MKTSLFHFEIPKVATFSKDKRMPIERLYRSFSKLDKNAWDIYLIGKQEIVQRWEKFSLDILGFTTKKRGQALWIIGGVHGEEPAGPNAIAQNIVFLNALAKKIPIVLIPLCNPAGYARDWRYVNLRRASRTIEAKSVGDADHLLPSLKNQEKPRKNKPTNVIARNLCNFILEFAKEYPPLLVIDLHEDESRKKLYIYSQGKLGSIDPIAKEIVFLLKKKGFQFYEQRETRFGEPIVNGIVGKVRDFSIDELLTAEKIIVSNKIKKGPGALSAITVETTTPDIPLSQRVRAHEEILQRAGEFFSMAKKVHKR
ncbi:MAG: Succinylglutamate desuccinylase / Aspartoacylase family [archaeon]|jgi:hypothetical protein